MTSRSRHAHACRHRDTRQRHVASASLFSSLLLLVFILIKTTCPLISCDCVLRTITHGTQKHFSSFFFTSVLRCGVRKPFCLELSRRSERLRKRFGKTKLLSIAPFPFFNYATCRNLRRPRPHLFLQVSARCRTREYNWVRSRIDFEQRERCSSSSGLLVDSFEDEGFRICSDALFELRRRRVMTRQGALVSEQEEKNETWRTKGGSFEPSNLCGLHAWKSLACTLFETCTRQSAA